MDAPGQPPSRRRIDAYDVVGFVGQGGMGTVLRARDPAGREVALKLLSNTLEASKRLRFEREARVTAALDHPGIVRVHTAGVCEGQPYIVFELVEGARELGEAFRCEPLTRRVEWVRDVARAVGYAHARGVVHRDLKAENVLVDAEGRVRVADFGVAFAAEEERITRTGGLVGTPTHLAPEQLAMRREAVGPRVDVWALGILLYQAMTGEPPFQEHSLPALLAAIASATPTPPREVDPQLSPALEAFCLRVLTADPAARPADGEAFARELGALLTRGDVRGDGRAARARRVLGAGLAGLSVVALLLVIGLVVALRRQRAPASAEPTVDLARLSSAASPNRELSPEDATRAAAERGEPWAMLRLGEGLERGEFGPPDPRAAAAWYERAARAGDPEGMTTLARWLLRPAAFAPERAAGEDWLRRAAQAGYAPAQASLARLLWAVEQRRVEARSWLDQAALQDDPSALLLVGELLERGDRLQVDAPRAVTWYERAAEAGEREALFRLGLLHAEGRGVVPDPRRAVEWFRLAAAEGHARAMAQLGRAYVLGQGVEQDIAAGVVWLGRGVEGGDVLARVWLATAYLSGEGVPRDPERGLAELRRSAQAGAATALDLLGHFHLEGRSVPRDPVQAAVYFRQAAELGFPECMADLADCYARGVGVPVDPQLARRWRWRAAEAGWLPALTWVSREFLARPGQAPVQLRAVRCVARAARQGHRRPMAQLGTCYQHGRGVPLDLAQARVWLRRAAELQDPLGQARLGDLYAKGLGVPKDWDEAARWYRPAALAGHRHAALMMAVCFDEGLSSQGVDAAQAVPWYQAAHAAGDSSAAVLLGRLYKTGRGVPQDLAQAAVWFQRAARMGHEAGMMELVGAYRNGRGVARDPQLAREWLERAAAQGDPMAQKRLLEASASGTVPAETESEKLARQRVAKQLELAKRGDPVAMVTLYRRYRRGVGCELDLPRALLWLRRAAALEHPEALFLLGRLQEIGDDVERDPEGAVALYRRAITLGEHPRAMRRLAACLREGRGAERDEQAAARLEAWARDLGER